MVSQALMPKAYKEVLEIIKYIPKEYYNKIPERIISKMENNKDNNYSYIVTNFNNFDEQEMLKETETILAIFYRDYWSTDEQRKEIKIKEKIDILENEREKREKYNPDNIFKSKKINTLEDEDQTTTLIEYKEPLFIRALNKIKSIFNKKI